MMFYLAIGAMVHNRSIVESFATKMEWSLDRATDTLTAYGSGMFLPTLEEVKALSSQPAFEHEWRLALYAFHVLDLQRMGHDLSGLASPDTISLWARGKRLLKPISRRRILEQFHVDVEQVPEGRRYTHAGKERPKVWFDSRRSQLHAPGCVWTLRPVHDQMYVVQADRQDYLVELETVLKEHGIQTTPSGDFILAEIPATTASIYYAKP